jgi:hypothetical protein
MQNYTPPDGWEILIPRNAAFAAFFMCSQETARKSKAGFNQQLSYTRTGC